VPHGGVSLGLTWARTFERPLRGLGGPADSGRSGSHGPSHTGVDSLSTISLVFPYNVFSSPAMLVMRKLVHNLGCAKQDGGGEGGGRASQKGQLVPRGA